MNNKKDVIKRDGRKENFDPQKIENAVLKAFGCVDGTISQEAIEIASNISNVIKNNYSDIMGVEDIQDAVENALMQSNRKDVAKAYIIYREDRNRIRQQKSDLMQRIGEKLKASNVQNQNANVDEKSFGGRKGEADSELLRDYALNYCMSEMAKVNHLNNEIYIHDLDHYILGDHNCFRSDTKFITTHGLRSFSDFKDGDTVTVLTPDGSWRKATVKNFGKQKVYKYIFKKNKTEIEIYATPNHRWLMQDGSCKEGLSVGDKLFESPYYWDDFNYNSLSKEGKFYWILGFIYGDGTRETLFSSQEQHYYKANTCKVKLCGGKVKFLPRFQELGYGTKCCVEEPEVGRIPYDKSIPDFSKLPTEDLIAFIHGYYDADGSKSPSGKLKKSMYSIQATGEESCDFIERYSATAGLYINSISDKTGQKTNFGTRGYTKSYQFFAKSSSKFHWYVKSVETTNDIAQDVWCLQVPDVHSFVLEGGIPTGNCLSIPFDKLLAKGFNTRQTDVRPARSVSTAFQLVAVIFQIQSLQQFGGVSATHIDHTMIPYVRMSFWKHYKDGIKYISKSVIPNDSFFGKLVFGECDEVSIDSEEYKKAFPDAYKYAMDMTEREIYQAVEGLYHNLNKIGRLGSNVRNIAI